MADTPSRIRIPSHPLNNAPRIPDPLQDDSCIKRTGKPPIRPWDESKAKPKTNSAANSTPKASDKTRGKAAPKIQQKRKLQEADQAARSLKRRLKRGEICSEKVDETEATKKGTICHIPKAKAKTRPESALRQVDETEATKNGTIGPPPKKKAKTRPKAAPRQVGGKKSTVGRGSARYGNIGIFILFMLY